MARIVSRPRKILNLTSSCTRLSSKKMAEIEARTWCYLNDKEFLFRDVTNAVDYATRKNVMVYPHRDGFQGFREIHAPLYLSSLDIIKDSILPNTYSSFSISSSDSGNFCSKVVYKGLYFKSPPLPSENFAFFYSALQALHYSKSPMEYLKDEGHICTPVVFESRPPNCS